MSKTYEERLKEKLEALAPSEEMMKMQKEIIESDSMKQLRKMNENITKQLRNSGAFETRGLTRRSYRCTLCVHQL